LRPYGRIIEEKTVIAEGTLGIPKPVEHTPVTSLVTGKRPGATPPIGFNELELM